MGRLTNLATRLAPAAPRLKRKTDSEGHSRAAEPWRAWYHTAEWRRLRQDTFLRDLYVCQMPGCGRVELNTSLLICDHRTPHRGDVKLFWSPSNLQTLCKPCHDKAKQRLERRGRGV